MNWFLLIIVYAYAFAKSDFKSNYPHGLLTDDYGILQEIDLEADAKDVVQTYPYNIHAFRSAYRRWQCFPVQDVSFSVETWKDNDPMGAHDIIVDLCLFSIEIKNSRPTHFYSGRRAYRLSYCNELKKTWNKLTSEEKYVCLNGEPGSLIHSEKSWTWNKFKTFKGCESYWEDSNCTN